MYFFALLFTLYPSECQSDLGMQSGAISDGQISASTQYDGNHAAIQGRLYFQQLGVKRGAWSVQRNDVNQWLQIDLGVHSRITRVASQGRHAVNQWVTKYKLQYGDDGSAFDYYVEEGKNAAKVN